MTEQDKKKYEEELHDLEKKHKEHEPVTILETVI